jgi:hypothetical protein
MPLLPETNSRIGLDRPVQALAPWQRCPRRKQAPAGAAGGAPKAVKGVMIGAVADDRNRTPQGSDQ